MEQEKKTLPTDELDLAQLFRFIRNGFKSFGYSILNALANIRAIFIDNKFFFIALAIVAISGSILYSKLIEKKYFTSSMIIKSEYLNMRIVQNSIEKLNLLCSEKDRTGLAEVLQIDKATAKNILRFSASNFVSEKDRVEIEILKEQLNSLAVGREELVSKVIGKIEIGNHQSFQISVQVNDPDIVKHLETALVIHFRENDYVKRRIEANVQNLLSRKTKLVSESRKLDSLKSAIFMNYQTMANQRRDGSNNVILSDKYLTDPVNVFKEDLNLNRELLDIEEILLVHPYFEVVDDLTTFREPANFSLLKVILISIAGSILTGYILLGLWKFNNYLATFNRTTQ
ncbi:MAG: hypothetical protein KF687_05980 [Cyclobacteriaceae bacterium]|nr:hypothetical protein [Cyclobacteriaceae bacterium]